jgi:hypothetical protein
VRAEVRVRAEVSATRPVTSILRIAGSGTSPVRQIFPRRLLQRRGGQAESRPAHVSQHGSRSGHHGKVPPTFGIYGPNSDPFFGGR